MTHRYQYDDKRRQHDPYGGPYKRRTQAAYRSCGLDQCFDEFWRVCHGQSPCFFRMVRKFLMARCVATLSAAIERPLMAEASFNDISLSLSIVTA